MAPEILTGLLVFAELVLPTLAIYAYLRSRGHTLAEAAAYGLGLPLMALAGIYQLAALAGRPQWAWMLEVILVLAGGIMVWRQGNPLFHLIREIGRFGRSHPVAVLSLGLGIIWLGVLSFSGTLPLHSAPRLQGHTFSELAASGLRPGNAQWAALFSLCQGTHWGVGLPTLWAYLTIGFATYALARRYAWPPTAITATLVVMSMPRLVALAPSGHPEIITSSIAILSLLAIYRMVERPHARDGIVLASAVAFTIGGPTSGLPLILPGVLALLVLVLILRRHDYRTILPALKAHPGHLLLGVLPVVILTQLPAVWYHLPWIDIVLNPDGLQGSLANLARYLLESFHLTQPVETLALLLWDYSPRLLLEQIHQQFIADPFGFCGGPRGTGDAFKIVWSATLPGAWFGPLSALLILPGIGYALIKGPRRLKAVAVALLGYLYLITLIPAWLPGNAPFFTPFFTLGGFCTAFFLPPWRFSRRGRMILQLTCAGLLGYVCLVNSTLLPTAIVSP